MSKYKEIQNYVISLINTGYLKPGSKIPPERELARRFGVTRMTVRNALSELVQKGILLRKQGSGTFVKNIVLEQPMGRLRSFTEEIRDLGHIPGTKFVSKKVVSPSDEIADFLKIPPSSEVLRVVRLRYVDGEVMSLNTSYFPLSRFPELNDVDFSQLSIYELIEKNLGFRITKAWQSLSAVNASAEQARMLELPEGAALLFLKRVTFIMDSVPIEYVEVLFRPDRYVFTIELLRE